MGRHRESVEDINENIDLQRESDLVERNLTSISTALHGVKRVLLISAAEVNRRFKLHNAVIDALSRQIGRDIPYRNLSHEDYAAILLDLGLPHTAVHVTIDADAKAIRGDLNSPSCDLSRLIGRPTTTLSGAVRNALRTQERQSEDRANYKTKLKGETR